MFVLEHGDEARPDLDLEMTCSAMNLSTAQTYCSHMQVDHGL